LIHQPSDPLRVIVVGRTGLEQSLRRDEAIELIRARTPMDALGELADPIDDASPSRAVVIVGEDTDRNEPAPERAAFLAALRSIDPGVRVLRVESDGSSNGSHAAHGYDATLSAQTDAQGLRELLNKPAPPKPASDSHGAQGSHETPPTPGLSAQQHIADEAIASALMRGHDIVPVAIDLIRARSGDNSVTYHAGDAQQSAGAGIEIAAPDGRVLGVLSGQDPEALRAHGAWLASWLRTASLQQELRDAAFRDHLTGAWNRRYFDRYLPACLERSRELRLPVTLMLFDIDDFKQYNDRYGHAAGDEILIESVRLLDSVIRPHDRVCRVGGDEFAVVFFEPSGPRDPGSAPPANVFVLAERFQQQICQHRFPKLGREAPGTLTISGGLATFPWDGSTPQELLEHADRLAMQSKQQGKNVLTLGPGAERYRAQGCIDRAE